MIIHRINRKQSQIMMELSTFAGRRKTAPAPKHANQFGHQCIMRSLRPTGTGQSTAFYRAFPGMLQLHPAQKAGLWSGRFIALIALDCGGVIQMSDENTSRKAQTVKRYDRKKTSGRLYPAQKKKQATTIKPHEANPEAYKNRFQRKISGNQTVLN